MEIRKVTKVVENNYPTLEKVNEKDLKKSIPKRWTKLGISMVVFNLLI